MLRLTSLRKGNQTFLLIFILEFSPYSGFCCACLYTFSSIFVTSTLSMRSRVYVTVGCPSVCLSVRLTVCSDVGPVNRQQQRRAAGLLLSAGNR